MPYCSVFPIIVPRQDILLICQTL